MIKPPRQIRAGLVLLAVVFIVSVVSWKLISGETWTGSLWYVVITFTTVGYGEKSTVNTLEQLATIAMIMAGLSALTYTSSVLLQAVVEGDLSRFLGARKLKRKIEELDQHVIVCGYGRLGQDLASQLTHRRIPFLVLDISEKDRDYADAHDVLLVHGDATREEVLLSVGIQRARTLVCALDTDADNVFVSLTARNLAPRIQIIARSEHASSCKKLRQAGADRIVMPYHSGAQQMERMISRPSTADLLELFSEVTNVRVELDEFVVNGKSGLADKSLGFFNASEQYNLIVVGLKNASGELLFNPPPETTLAEGDSLLVMGSASEIARFRQLYRL